MKNILVILLASPIFLAFYVKENTPGIPLNDTVDKTMTLSGDNYLFGSAWLQ